MTKQNATKWDSILARKIINQKILVLQKLEDNEQISEALLNSQMLGTVTNIEPYEENAIYEFYSNLGTGTTTPSDPMYGKVYLRGNFYNFTPALINEYMGTSPREEEAEVTSERVAQELTAGNGPLVNWMPSLHENTVKWSLAELLYKVGKGIKINFGEMVLSQIMNFVESGLPKASLVFPNLIHTLLVQQKFKLQKPMVPVKPLSISVKLRRGTHQNDLKTITPKENPTDKTTPLKYFQKKLTEIEQEESWISKRHLELKEEKSEWKEQVPPSKVAYIAMELLNMGCFEISLGDTIGVGTLGSDKLFFLHSIYLEGTSLATIFAHPSIIEMLDAAVEDTVDSVAAASSGTHDELHASKGTTSSLADSNETGNDGGAAEAGSDNLDSAPSKSKKNQKKGKGSSTSQEVSSKLNAKKEEDHTRSQKID
nr:uncharacterized protein LOC109159961 [Ipomoea batatas]